ncbi:MAG: dihydroneopterin aldolase [Bacteroidales bacterium]|jgi:dihydroneopterin aldolase|nr:dihydroneopterin aldolase [Bacteroidales bacterium]MDD2570682.1 dihydroneopterin aldolase [Bacteroidales bacterium]MDD2813837.1 dihydroneopterin aldolase [Bacteroidales bacterium]MDD3386117.1 dihydroneopterin aldolase [Bacteroidales bacterium]MDD3812097.1 dihydroneopterin aldolase [Bacteroidales bacterium]
MGLIRIEQMEFYSFHGCYEEERIVGNRFIVDLEMEADCTLPATSDRIKDALNYQVAYKLVKEQMQEKSYLLEHLAARILDTLFAHFEQLERATVKVTKLNPPMGGKIGAVSVELSREVEGDLSVNE